MSYSYNVIILSQQPARCVQLFNDSAYTFILTCSRLSFSVHVKLVYRIVIGIGVVGSVALLVARRTNDRMVAGSRPTKVVCITVDR